MFHTFLNLILFDAHKNPELGRFYQPHFKYEKI